MSDPFVIRNRWGLAYTCLQCGEPARHAWLHRGLYVKICDEHAERVKALLPGDDEPVWHEP